MAKSKKSEQKNTVPPAPVPDPEKPAPPPPDNTIPVEPPPDETDLPPEPKPPVPPEKIQPVKQVRKVDVLRIRKSNTRNSLFENEIGKQFIAAARAEVKKSEIQEDKQWFIVWEIIEE